MTVEQIVAACAEAGVVITARQLERWREFGLLLAGTRHSEGRGRGVWWTFPPSTVERVLAIVRMREGGFDLADAGVHLWLDGNEFEERHVRKWLDNRLRRIKRLRERIQRRGPSAVASKFVDGLRRSSRETRRRYGVFGNDIEAYDAPYEGIKQTMQSMVDCSLPLAPQAIDLIFKSFGIPSAEVERAKALDLDIEGGIPHAIEILATIDDLVEDATPGELEMARTLSLSMSAMVEKLRNRPTNENSEFARSILAYDDDMRYRSAFGVLFSLATIRRATMEFGIDRVLQNLAEAERVANDSCSTFNDG